MRHPGNEVDYDNDKDNDDDDDDDDNDDDDDDDDKFWFGAKIIHSSSVLRGATKR